MNNENKEKIDLLEIPREHRDIARAAYAGKVIQFYYKYSPLAKQSIDGYWSDIQGIPTFTKGRLYRIKPTKEPA